MAEVSDVPATVFGVIEKEFGLPAGTVTRETVAADIDGWDSLRHATLLILVERRFKFEFRGQDVADLENVGDLIDAVEARLG